MSVENFFERTDPVLVGGLHDLNEALFAYKEEVGWKDYVDSLSDEQAILCWKIVETLRERRFPKDLMP